MKSRHLSMCLAGLVVLALAAASLPWRAHAQEQTNAGGDLRAMDVKSIRVITANIRYADPHDNQNAWPNRRELFVKTLLLHQPDLIGFQEVTPAQGLYLQREFKDFAFVSSVEGEDLATAMLSGLDSLAYRKDRFELVASAAGLIRPDAIQKTATENAFYTLAVLRDTHHVFPDIIFLNTHIRHDPANAVACTTRLRGILAEQLKKHPDAAVVVTGDFNHDRTEPAVAAFLDKKMPGPALADSFDYAAKKSAEKWGTYHGFTGTAPANLPTDLIFTSGVSASAAEILKDHMERDAYPSDHFFVKTDIQKITH